MKSIILNKLREEFGVRKVSGKKLEFYSFYDLVGIYKRLSQGEEIK